jgi:DNA adenine methylase
MDRVCVEQLDWSVLMDRYDGPETFWFLDPPYIGGDTAYAAWTAADLERFAARVKLLKGRWLLTFNDCPQIRSLFAGHAITRHERSRGIANRRACDKARYIEVLVRSLNLPICQPRKSPSVSQSANIPPA